MSGLCNWPLLCNALINSQQHLLTLPHFDSLPYPTLKLCTPIANTTHCSTFIFGPSPTLQLSQCIPMLNSTHHCSTFIFGPSPTTVHPLMFNCTPCPTLLLCTPCSTHPAPLYICAPHVLQLYTACSIPHPAPLYNWAAPPPPRSPCSTAHPAPLSN
jgi:hypothetical protein